MIAITSTTTQLVIPLTNTPQSFNINLASYPYIMTVKWNDASGSGWAMDIQDGNTSAYLACNIPFITGVDLLDGLEYLGINGSLIVYTNGNSYSVPTLDNLGVNCNLYFLTNSNA